MIYVTAASKWLNRQGAAADVRFLHVGQSQRFRTGRYSDGIVKERNPGSNSYLGAVSVKAVINRGYLILYKNEAARITNMLAPFPSFELST